MSLIECGASYDQAMWAYRRGPHKITARLIPVEGLYPSLTAYNCTPMVDGDGELHLLSRVELPGSEVSEVRKLDFTSCHAYPNGFVVPNGLVISDAQDPFISLVSRNKPAIGVVAITEDPAFRGKVAAYWPQLYEFEGGGMKVARGPKDQKDIRVVYMGLFGGQDLSVIVARERQENGYNIHSYLQVGIVPTAGDMQQLSGDITQVKNDPTSRLNVLIPDNRTWFGPNQIIPLQSQENDLVFGLLFHTGRFTNRLYKNGEWGRDYKTWVTEISADPGTRQATRFTKPEVIATANNFSYTEAKRPDLWDVFFPGGFLFGINSRGGVEQTVLAGGLRDRYNGWVRMGYPFSLPLNLELNRLSTMPVEKMPKI